MEQQETKQHFWKGKKSLNSEMFWQSELTVEEKMKHIVDLCSVN